MYDTINHWWVMYAKIQIKNFFINISKEQSQMKYGLLELLEIKLNRLYEKVNRTGEANYDEIREIKDRINSIKTEILEGVKIRSREQEQIEGERVSAYLIGKQGTIKSKKGITNQRFRTRPIHEQIEVTSMSYPTGMSKSEST